MVIDSDNPKVCRETISLKRGIRSVVEGRNDDHRVDDGGFFKINFDPLRLISCGMGL